MYFLALSYVLLKEIVMSNGQTENLPKLVSLIYNAKDLSSIERYDE